MKKKTNVSDKIHLFTVFSASLIILTAGIDAFLEHNSINGADIFIATAGFIAFLLIIIYGFTLTKTIIKPLLKIMEELNMESQDAAAASIQVEAASREIAEASIEESSSIQETAATLEETTSMICQNNTNTQEVAKLSEHEKNLSEKSYEEMVKLIEYMDKIKESSEEITKVVKVIDQIAFKTNLLSLNASVEAAKIGREGDSFAVVAEEIRNLSQKTEQASKDTEEIINKNILLVKEGHELALDVENSLSEIDKEAKKISNYMGEISTASMEQARGVEEIQKAVSQMEQATHMNAHSANECATAAKDLSHQADYVKEIISELSEIIKGTKEEEETQKSKEIRTAKVYVTQ